MTLQYQLSQSEQSLVGAALGLADWLVAQRETTRGQRKIIQQLQEALRLLPSVPDGLSAEFGFHFRALNGEGWLYRAWRISFSPAGLEIYSVYTPDQPIDVREKMSNELNFWIRPGETSGHDGHYLAQWIAEVKTPDSLRAGALEFEVHAIYFD